MSAKADTWNCRVCKHANPRNGDTECERCGAQEDPAMEQPVGDVVPTHIQYDDHTQIPITRTADGKGYEVEIGGYDEARICALLGDGGIFLLEKHGNKIILRPRH